MPSEPDLPNLHLDLPDLPAADQRTAPPFIVDNHLRLIGPAYLLDTLPFQDSTLDFARLLPVPEALQGQHPNKDTTLADLFLSVYQGSELDLTARTFLLRTIRKASGSDRTYSEEQAIRHFIELPGLRELALHREQQRVRYDAADEDIWKHRHWGVTQPAREGHQERHSPTELELSFETMLAPPIGIFSALDQLGLQIEVAYWGETSEFAGMIDRHPDGTLRHVRYAREQLHLPSFTDEVLNEIAERVSRNVGFRTLRWHN